MRIALQLVSRVALAGTIVPTLLFLVGWLTLDNMKLFMLIATIVWFALAPLSLDRTNRNDELVT
jgi:hypothetical protein